MTEQWRELKETITEMRDNDGTGTQQEVCKFLVNLMDVLEKQMSNQNKGEWIMPIQDDGMSDPIYYQVRCSKCGFDLDPQTWHQELHQYGADKFCPNCGADMRGE